MLQYLVLALAMAAVGLAQIPTDLPFQRLTEYYPFISLSAAPIANDTRASENLASPNSTTIFLSLNAAFEQFLAQPPSSPAAGQIESVNFANPALTSDLFQYLQLDGLRPSTSFNGTSFVTTRLNNSTYNHVSGGAKIQVFRNETAFYIKTGINFKSNVVIPDIPFAGGILHIVDHPASPPYDLADTGVVLDITYLMNLTAKENGYTPTIQNTTDTTVFAPSNDAVDSILGTSQTNSTYQQLAEYVVAGSVAYSTNLTDGATLQTVGGQSLVVYNDANGNIFVNSSRVIESDILTQNGVVHIIDRAFT